MDKHRINVDIDRELWKRVSIRCVELDMEKREFVEEALSDKLERERKELIKIEGEPEFYYDWVGRDEVKVLDRVFVGNSDLLKTLEPFTGGITDGNLVKAKKVKVTIEVLDNSKN